MLRQNILTAGVPLGSLGLPLAAQAPLDVRERVAVGRQYFAQQSDVSDGQTERVDLAEPLLVRKRGHVTAELVERRVYAAKRQRRHVIDSSVVNAQYADTFVWYAMSRGDIWGGVFR